MNECFQKQQEKQQENERKTNKRKDTGSCELRKSKGKERRNSIKSSKQKEKKVDGQKHTYEEVVNGKRVTLPEFYNETFEKTVMICWRDNIVAFAEHYRGCVRLKMD